MNNNVVTITKDRPVVDAADLMRKNSIGCVIVIDNDVPIGIVSERDIIRKVVAKRRDPSATVTEDIMSMNLITVETNMEIKDVSQRMVQYNIKKIPVVRDGKLRGIITSTDIVRIMAQFNKLYDAKEIIELGG